jgi:hypothetical protein
LLTADESTTEDALAGSQARYRMDNTLLVKFYNKPRLDKTETEKQGRPIFKEVPFVRIQTPGNKDNIMSRPAMEMDKQRFSEHWRRFLAREEAVVEGTLLSEWGGVTRSQVEEMKFFSIYTVEQLAAMPDSNTQNMMGLAMLKQKAGTYLEDSDKNATSNELSALRSESEAMKAQIAELLANKPVEKPKRKRRSRAQMDADNQTAETAAADALKAALME